MQRKNTPWESSVASDTARKLTRMVESPYSWYETGTFCVLGLGSGLFEKMKEDRFHLMRANNKCTQFLGGYVLGYALREGIVTEGEAEAWPFEKKYLDPFMFARVMEISPETIPLETSGRREQNVLERVMHEGKLVYKMHVRTLGRLLLPTVPISDTAKMSLQEIVLKQRFGGKNALLENEYGKRAGAIARSAIAQNFERYAQRRSLLAVIGTRSVKEAMMTFDLTKDYPIESWIRDKAVCAACENLREDKQADLNDQVRLLVAAARADGEKMAPEHVYRLMPEDHIALIKQAYARAML